MILLKSGEPGMPHFEIPPTGARIDAIIISDPTRQTVLLLSDHLIKVTGSDGESVSLRRQGYGVTIGADGRVSQPFRTPPAELEASIARTQGVGAIGRKADEQTLTTLAQQGSSQSIAEIAPGHADRSLSNIDPRVLNALAGLAPGTFGDLQQQQFASQADIAGVANLGGKLLVNGWSGTVTVTTATRTLSAFVSVSPSGTVTATPVGGGVLNFAGLSGPGTVTVATAGRPSQTFPFPK